MGYMNLYDAPSASAFGTSLFSEMCADIPSGNVLISPLSISKALVLAKDGATIGSENESELDKVLGPAPALGTSDGGVDGDAGVKLVVASSIWANLLKQSCVDGAASRHSAEAFPLPSHYAPVSRWIEERTDGMIKGFMGDGAVDRDTMALLVNAVYFKGTWTHQFDPAKTVDGEFVPHDGTKARARFMSDTRRVGLIRESSALGGASAVSLDYGKKADGGDGPTEFTSLFVLPAAPGADSMRAAISGLNSRPLSDLLDEAWETKVKLKLPRFRLEFGTKSGPATLKPSLRRMGVGAAFDESILGKFEEMSDDPKLTIDDVLHGAVMEVTEEGTEASAATAVQMMSRSMPPPTPELFFDRPFLVAVVHRRTGTPLFLGRVETP